MEESFPTRRVLRLGAEALVQDLLAASRQAKVMEHLEGYRTVENLMVDNLWVLAGKPATAAWIAEILHDRQAPGQLTVVASDLSIADWAGKSESIAKLLVEGEMVWLAPASEVTP
jgi:chromosomal replication initiation ATPase DnaA